METDHAELAKNRAYAKFDIATFGTGSFYIADALFRRIRGVKTVVTGYAGGGEFGELYAQDTCWPNEIEN
jgi:peptide methionine sulfoxide reductase MsrA